MSEKEMRTKINYMTQETKKRLEEEFDDARKRVKNAGQQVGESLGPEGAWHDNAAYDAALVERDVADANLLLIRDSLHNVEIIKPCQETDIVALGNTVTLRFEGEDDEEKITILGQQDGITGRDKGWVSFETPLAQAVLGAKAGDKVELKLDSNTQFIKIVAIEPGDF